MRYEGPVYRPPSEADSFLLQATIGCSWNRCTYCAMYRHKTYRERPVREVLADVDEAARIAGDTVRKVFVMDGDALEMGVDSWEVILERCRSSFPRLRRVSAYATAMNLLAKPAAELRRLRQAGLRLLYVGPESGDDPTLKRIAKGAGHDEHVEAARRGAEAGIDLSAIFLLGAGGTERSDEHAHESARLATSMDPKFLSLLTLSVVPGTPLERLEATGRFELPTVTGLLRELRTFVAEARPSDAIFRTNHASNYLPLAGRLPRDRDRLVALLDDAIEGRIALRPEWSRGL